jgi:hypothetical protein
MKQISLFAICLLFMSQSALADCNTGASAVGDCFGGIAESIPEVINTSEDEGVDRVETVGGSLQECHECILEGLKNDLNKITTSVTGGDAIK